MSKGLYRLLIYTVANNLVFTFVNLFLNLYIFQQNKSIGDMAIFNIAQFTIWAIVYPISSYLFFKTSLKVVFRFSSFFSILLFASLVFIEFDNPIIWLVFSGSMFGLMRCLFSTGSTQAIGVSGKRKEFTFFFQIREFWVRAVNILAPIVFAILLIQFDYQGLFLIMLLFSFFLFALTFILVDIKPEQEFEEKLFTNFSPKKAFENKRYKKLPLSYFTGGIFLEFQAIFILFFTFTITSDKLTVALLNTFYALLAFACIKVYRKFSIKDVQWLLIGIIFVFLGFGAALFLKGWWMIIPNVLLVLGNFYYRTTYFSQHFQAISESNPMLKFRITIWREIMLCISRVMILSLILVMERVISEHTYIYYLTGIVFVIALTIPFIHRSFEIKEK